MTGSSHSSHLEVEAGGWPRHQVGEVLVEILAQDVLGHGLVGVERLLLFPWREERRCKRGHA